MKEKGTAEDAGGDVRRKCEKGAAGCAVTVFNPLSGV